MKVDFNFDDSIFWELIGAMEREENITEEETQYLLWKILKGIVSEGEKSFTEKQRKQYKEWAMSEDELTERFFSDILENFKKYAAKHDVHGRKEECSIAWEDYWDWKKQIEKMIEDKYTRVPRKVINELLTFMNNTLPQKFWDVSESYFKKHPDVDFGEATFSGTSFPEPLQYGDIIISNSRMDEAIFEFKDRINHPENYAWEKMSFPTMSTQYIQNIPTPY